MSKTQEEIFEDLMQLSNDGYIQFIHSNPILTDKGLEIAKKIYRKHELFENFFKFVMKMNDNESHKLSDILEHTISDKFETKIRKFLKIRKVVPLIFLKKGEKGRLVRIDGGRVVTRRLNELGIVGNVEILVKEEAPLRGPMKIQVRNSNIILGYGEAKKIIVEIQS